MRRYGKTSHLQLISKLESKAHCGEEGSREGRIGDMEDSMDREPLETTSEKTL